MIDASGSYPVLIRCIVEGGEKMKRLIGLYKAVLTAFLIIARGTAVHADDFKLSVKGIAVTPENASDILGDGTAA